MLPLLSRHPAAHQCFVGDLKLLLNRVYFFKTPQKHALSPSICSTLSWLFLSTLTQNFVFMHSLVCPHGCVGRKAPAHRADAQQEGAGRAVVPLLDLALHHQPLHPSAHQPCHPSGHHSCLCLQHPPCRYPKNGQSCSPAVRRCLLGCIDGCSLILKPTSCSACCFCNQLLIILGFLLSRNKRTIMSWTQWEIEVFVFLTLSLLLLLLYLAWCKHLVVLLG